MSPQDVRAAYAELASGTGGWVSIADLRARFAGVPRDEMDRLLREMSRAQGVSVIPNSQQGDLTDTDRAGGLRIGNQQRHLIRIDQPPAAGEPVLVLRPGTRITGGALYRPADVVPHSPTVPSGQDVRATPVTYTRRGEPQFTRREGETPEQAARRYRREYAESPAGQREAARAALRPRVEALADRIRRMDNAEDITAAIEAGQLPTEALKLLAEEVDVDPAAVGRVGGRRQRIALLAELLAQEVRKGPGGFR